MYAREILEAERLPIYLTAYTPCFRREKMSAGRDVRGIKRGHQFDKVEMVKLVHPETSDDELEKLVENACEVCRRLEIPFRVIQMCTGDLGFAARREVRRRDVGARVAANGSRSARARTARTFRRAARKSGFARRRAANPSSCTRSTARAWGCRARSIAVLENYQNEDGSITIPQVLRPYMGGLEKISKA